MGDSLLQGMEATICWSDLLSKDVCCLPGIWFQDAVERLPRFVWSSDYFPLLLFHVGTNDTGRGTLECSKHDYIALEVKAKGMGGPGGISLILPVRGKGLMKNGCILWANKQLHSQC